MTRIFSSFESLEAFLAEWTSWNDGEYDVGGVVVLLRACLRNLFNNAIAGDLESLPGRFTEQEKELLATLLKAVQDSGDDNDDE